MRRGLEERHGERERIARDLHDTLLQSVQGLILRFLGGGTTCPVIRPRVSGSKAHSNGPTTSWRKGRDSVRILRARQSG